MTIGRASRVTADADRTVLTPVPAYRTDGTESSSSLKTWDVASHTNKYDGDAR
jgi:hypothetical protein